MAKIPVRYIRDWTAASNANPAAIWSEIKVFRNGENIALGILPTSSVPLLGGTGIITNGIINPNEYSFSNAYSTPIYVDIDLGEIYTDLEAITIWHYGDGRIFTKTKTEVSKDGINWVPIFDSDIEGTYAETAEGHSIILPNTNPARYIRDWLGKGSTFNGQNHWIEIEAHSNGVNVAEGKTAIVAAGAITGWFPPSFVTDGILGDFVEVIAAGEKAAIQVDLGELFDIDEIKIWHYYTDGRTYHDTRTEISEDGIKWRKVFDSTIEGEYQETSEGHSILLKNVPYGYTNEAATSETINMSITGAQEHEVKWLDFEQSTTELIKPLTITANVTVIYSEGLEFEQSTAELIKPLTIAENMTIVYSEGLDFTASGSEAMPVLRATATQEKTGVFEQAAAHTIALSITAISTKKVNFLTFEQSGAEAIALFAVTTTAERGNAAAQTHAAEVIQFMGLTISARISKATWSPYEVEVFKPVSLFEPTAKDRAIMERSRRGLSR